MPPRTAAMKNNSIKYRGSGFSKVAKKATRGSAISKAIVTKMRDSAANR